MTANARIRLKLLGYLCAARPHGQDSPTLTQGLALDGFAGWNDEQVRRQLDLMQCDGLAEGKMDTFTKSRLLWHVTDAGIEAALKQGIALA